MPPMREFSFAPFRHGEKIAQEEAKIGPAQREGL